MKVNSKKCKIGAVPVGILALFTFGRFVTNRVVPSSYTTYADYIEHKTKVENKIDELKQRKVLPDFDYLDMVFGVDQPNCKQIYLSGLKDWRVMYADIGAMSFV